MADAISSVVMLFNHYLNPGGEQRAFESEVRLLQRYGVRVLAVTEQTRPPSKLSDKIGMAAGCFWSQAWYEKMRHVLASRPVDVVHVHNAFPVMSPSIYFACRKERVPVVQTLHNYRLLCPKATLYRNGHVCEDCLGRTPWPALLHACYRSSRPQTAVVAAMLAANRAIGTWRNRVSIFVALSDFAKQKFVQAGMPPQKIVVKPNFCHAHISGDGRDKRRGALFVGRFTRDKGIRTLMDAWQALHFPLRMVGDGPLSAEAKRAAPAVVAFTGWLSDRDVSSEMRRASFLVVPSLLYECSPLVIQEAFAHGLPVIASGLGSLAEIVQDGVTGLHFEAGNSNDLSAKVQWAASHPNEMRTMGENAEREHRQRYTPERNYEMLTSIYRQAVDEYAW